MPLKSFLKKIIPISIRKKRGEYQYKFTFFLLKQKILGFLRDNYDKVDGGEDVYRFLKTNSFFVFPYNFIKKYNSKDIIVYDDTECGTKYVLHENKRLYFKQEFSIREIQEYYSGLMLEQDIDSPHRYEYKDFRVHDGDVVVDAGVAEGNFALSVVERVKKLYLFEADESWTSVLKKTFEPWKDKVVIVNKYVSDNNNGDNVRIDDYFEGRTIDFLKADVEGAEMQLLSGASKALSAQHKLKVIICTYHRQNDGEDINKIMKGYNFSTEFSKGYMIFSYDKELAPPYLRKGLLRCVKM